MTIPSTTDRRSGRDRDIEARSGRRVRVIEAGEGPPVVFLHGSSTSSLSLLPVLERLEGVRAIAVDRPGFGLSEPVRVPRERFRDAAVEFLDEVLDELGLQTSAFAGNSMGGTWAVWYALARPERVRRLVLLGSAPLLPGTRPPLPLRVTAAPLVGDLLPHVVKPNRKLLVRLMASMGEEDTIVRYPELIESLVAAARDPIASAANLAELRAIISPIGFRPSARIDPDELRRLNVPTLLIWVTTIPSELPRSRARRQGSCLGRSSSCCQPATSPTSVTRSECPISCPRSSARHESRCGSTALAQARTTCSWRSSPEAR